MKSKVAATILGLLLVAFVTLLSSTVAYAAGPTFQSGQVFSIAENSPAGTATSPTIVKAVDPEGQPLTYAITGGTGESTFGIGATTGAVTVVDNTLLDYETVKSLTITVQVTDVELLTNLRTFTVNLTPVSDEPPSMNDQSFNVGENSPNNTIVGTMVVTDADQGETFSFSIDGGNTGSAFAINSSGQIRVANGSSLNYENLKEYLLDISVEDSGGKTASAVATINLTNANEAPSVTPAQSFSVDEDKANGFVIGTVAATDPENDTLQFSITNNPPIAINKDTGVLTVKDTTLIDFNLAPSISVNVQVSDGSLTGNGVVTINVNEVNDAPITSGISNVIVNEGDPSPVINLFAAFSDDEDADAALLYTVEGKSNPGLFTSTPINSGSGTLTLNFAPGVSGSSNVTVRATDTGGKFVEATFTASINSAPTTSSIPDVTVSEDAPNTTINLYDYFADNEEADSALSYTVVGNTNGGIFSSVSINKPTLTLDYADNANGKSTLTIRATDSKGLTADNTLKVTVNAVNDTPTTSGIANVNVNEDAPDTVINLWPAFSDIEDTDDELTFTVFSNSNPGLFDGVSIDNATGKLTLKYKANGMGTANIVIRAKDSGNATVDAPFTVTVSGQNDEPTVTGFTKQATEDTPLPLPAADFTNHYSDPENDPMAAIKITQLPDANKGTLKVGANTVEVDTPIPAASLGSLTFQPAQDWDEGSTTFKWTATDGASYAAAPATVTINITAENDAPVVSNFSKVGTENEPITFGISDFVTAFFDVDGDPLAKVKIVSLPPNGTLKLNGSNVLANAQINRDNLDELTFVPNASWSGATSFGWSGNDGFVYGNTANVNITVNPINDPPSVDLNGAGAGNNFTVTYNTNAGPVAIMDADGTVADIDSNTLASATIIIVNRKDGTAEKLTANKLDTDITISYNNANGVMSLQGPDTIANFQKVLRTIKYENTSLTPNLTKRQVSVRVNDGDLNSPDATTTVEIVNPRVDVSVEKSLQSVVNGGTAIFTISITNTGDVPLNNVEVKSTAVPDCNRSLGSLAAGASIAPFACLKENVSQNFTNTVVVTAKETQGNTTVTDSDTGQVKVENPNVQIDVAPDPVVGDTLLKGQEAKFLITVINPSGLKLKDVSVTAESSPLPSEDPTRADQATPVPSCAKTIGDLAAGAESNYECTVPNVQSPFQIKTTVTGKLDTNNTPVSDFDIADINVLNLTVEVGPAPSEIAADKETKVRYNITVTNNGSKTVTLKQLQSITSQGQPLHGNLLDPNNSLLLANTCDVAGPLPELLANGGAYPCYYEINITALPPAFTNVVAATVQDASGNVVTAEGQAIISVTDEKPVNLALTANPPSLIAPGGQVTLNVQVVNNLSTPIQLTALSDQGQGNLDGKGCEVPQTIAAKDSYTCQYQANVTGQTAGNKVVFKVNATVTGQDPLSDTVEVPITAKGTKSSRMPVVTNGIVAGEPNNSVCGAMPIIPLNNYYFLPDDANDWYYFNLTEPGKVSILINNYVAEGQVVIYTGACTGPTFLQNNGDAGYVPNRELKLGVQPAGRYYIWILSDAKQSASQQYTLRVNIE